MGMAKIQLKICGNSTGEAKNSLKICGISRGGGTKKWMSSIGGGVAN
jgi:hypothetical protein